MASEWHIRPWEIGRLSARDWQDVRLAEQAETYIQQQQRKRGPGGTQTGLEHRQSKQQRVNDAIQKHTS